MQNLNHKRNDPGLQARIISLVGGMVVKILQTGSTFFPRLRYAS
jgi:hypothetical protein